MKIIFQFCKNVKYLKHFMSIHCSLPWTETRKVITLEVSSAWPILRMPWIPDYSGSFSGLQALVKTVKSPKGLSGKICPPPVGKFFRQSLRTIHCLSDPGLQKPKKMQPRVALWACQEKQWARSCPSLTVVNPDFGG